MILTTQINKTEFKAALKEKLMFIGTSYGNKYSQKVIVEFMNKNTGNFAADRNYTVGNTIKNLNTGKVTNEIFGEFSKLTSSEFNETIFVMFQPNSEGGIYTYYTTV